MVLANWKPTPPPRAKRSLRCFRFGVEHEGCKLAFFGFNCTMQTLEKIEAEVKQLSPADQEALRDWLENLIEDRMKLKDEFKAEIEAGVKDIAEGRYRIHRP